MGRMYRNAITAITAIGNSHRGARLRCLRLRFLVCLRFPCAATAVHFAAVLRDPSHPGAAARPHAA